MLGIALLFSTVVLPVQDKCPVVLVSSSSSEKGKATYTANVSGGDGTVSPSYNWSISDGGIVEGQGTSTISVEATPGNSVTATVDVGGYGPTCSTSSSSTETISATTPCSVLGVEGGKDEKGRTVFRATADPIPSGNFSFKWTLVGGKIIDGLGSGVIAVQAPKGSKLTAAMVVTGLEAGCENKASGSYTVP